jgi:hypothetical protein
MKWGDLPGARLSTFIPGVFLSLAGDLLVAFVQTLVSADRLTWRRARDQSIDKASARGSGLFGGTAWRTHCADGVRDAAYSTIGL